MSPSSTHLLEKEREREREREMRGKEKEREGFKSCRFCRFTVYLQILWKIWNTETGNLQLRDDAPEPPPVSLPCTFRFLPRSHLSDKEQ